MPSTDDRIVKISFDNSDFQKNVAETIQSISELDDAIASIGAQNGLNDLSIQANNVDFGGIGDAVSNISQKFSTLGVIGFSVIQNLTNAALGFVSRIGSDIIEPIFSGGLTRAKNIEQAKFMFEGLGIDIAGAMQNALDAVKGTAFGLDEAAKAAAQFGASGIQVGSQMTSALRGVAGAAALTGRSFTEIADIFAGSAGTGIVNNLDLQQFATRGLNAASAVAKVMGITEAQVHELASSGKLDFATFAAAMDSAFGAHATEANKTFSGSMANMKAALSRLGAAIIAPELTNLRDVFNSFTPVIDNFTAASAPLIETFTNIASFVKTNVVNSLNGISFDNLKAAMPLISKGLLNVFESLSGILNIGKQAFANIFPPGGESLIIKISAAFAEFTSNLFLSEGAITKVRTIFEGFFAGLSIGWTILKEGVGFILNLGKSLISIFSGDVLNGITRLSSKMVDLKKSLVDDGGIKRFFDGLTEAVKKPVAFVQALHDGIGKLIDFFKGGIPGDFEGGLGRVGDRISSVRDVIAKVLGVIGQPLEDAFVKVTDVLGSVFDKISTFAHEFGAKLAELFKKGDFSPVVDAINSGLLLSIVLLLKKFLDNGLTFFVKGTLDLAGGVLQSLTRSFSELTGTLKAMQTNLKANALLKIAIAIGILTASLVALSLIDSVSLSKALAAMAVGFTELMGSFALFTKLVTGPKAALAFAITAAGLILLSGSMFILAIAAKILSTIDWQGLAKGLIGIGVGLGLMVAAVKLLPKGPGLITSAIALIAVATSLVILAVAMKIFATLSWEEIAKGLVGVAGGLTAMTLALNLMPKGLSMIKTGAGLIAIAIAMNILAIAMKIFATFSWEEIGKGLTGIGGGLVLIAAAMNLMPKDMLATSAGLLIVSVALIAIATAVKLFGSMSWEEIGKGLITLAVSLGILALAMHLMEGAIPGAVALAIVAASLVLLTGVLKTIGKMSWTDIAKGLITLAGAMLLIAGASILLSEAVPFIAAFGLALLPLGLGFALVGAGLYLISKGFATFVAVSKAAAEALPVFLEVLGKSVAAFVAGIAQGVIDAVKPLIKALPLFAKLIGKLISLLIDEVIKLAPKFGDAIQVLIEEFFKVVKKYAAQYIDAGFFIIKHFLQGVSDNIGPIVTIVGDIITKFLDAMTKEIPRIATSVATTIETAITEAANKLGEISATILFGVGVAFIEGFLTGLKNTFDGPVAEFFLNLASTVLAWIGDTLGTLVQKGVDIITGFLNGVINAIFNVVTFFVNLGTDIFNWVGELGSTLINKGFSVIVGLYTGITGAWNIVSDWLGNLGGKILHAVGDVADFLSDVGGRIMKGLYNGMKNFFEDTISGWLSSLGSIIEHLKGPPAKDSVMLTNNGMLIMQGLQNGMETVWGGTEKWLSNLDPSEHLKTNLASNMSKILSSLSDGLNSIENFNPIITPVLDLTQVQKDASQISKLVDASSVLTPSVSTDHAALIARASALYSGEVSPPVAPAKDVKFEQNIYAPTRLSASDIYKQTRNQITIAKEELSIS